MGQCSSQAAVHDCQNILLLVVSCDDSASVLLTPMADCHVFSPQRRIPRFGSHAMLSHFASPNVTTNCTFDPGLLTSRLQAKPRQPCLATSKPCFLTTVLYKMCFASLEGQVQHMRVPTCVKRTQPPTQNGISPSSHICPRIASGFHDQVASTVTQSRGWIDQSPGCPLCLCPLMPWLTI